MARFKRIQRLDRWAILNRDGFKCHACGRGPADGLKLHVDQWKPRSKGGTNDESNLVTLCEECNESKMTREPTIRLPEFGAAEKTKR